MATFELIPTMKQNIIETIVGCAVIILTIVFFIFAYRIGNSSKIEEGYLITATFQSAEGIVQGSNVMLAGIKIGHVKTITLDKTNFFALLHVSINKDILLPKDSRAVILTSGLFGARYISIIPGGSEENLMENDQIKYTQSTINIESLIDKFIYSFGHNK